MLHTARCKEFHYPLFRVNNKHFNTDNHKLTYQFQFYAAFNKKYKSHSCTVCFIAPNYLVFDAQRFVGLVIETRIVLVNELTVVVQFHDHLFNGLKSVYLSLTSFAQDSVHQTL